MRAGAVREPGGCRDDAVAIASWGIDIHEMERVAIKDPGSGKPIAYNEGLTSPLTGGRYFFEMPYYILLPKRADLVNLAAAAGTGASPSTSTSGAAGARCTRPATATRPTTISLRLQSIVAPMRTGYARSGKTLIAW